MEQYQPNQNYNNSSDAQVGSRSEGMQQLLKPQHTTSGTKGWCITDWQYAYQQAQIVLSDLSNLIDSYCTEDLAWICIASPKQIEEQIQALNVRVAESALLPTDLAFWHRFPLYGIPFAVKDNIDVSSFASTAGCVVLNEIKTQDAEVVRRLKQAGAIVLGKTNLDQFATGLVGTRSPYGAVPNSFDSAYVSGGSSSGSASVVARGMVPFSLGTDTAGSGRVPAAFNNIVGLKPTKGRFSNRGVVPACKSIDCVSIFALCIEDAAQVAQILEGYDQEDVYSRQHPENTPATFSTHPHFAIPAQLEFFNDEQAEQAFAESVDQLKQLGVRITAIDFSVFEQLAAQLYAGSWVAERTAAVGDLLTQHADQVDATVREIISQGLGFSAVDAYQAEYLRRDLSRKIQQTLSEFDALLVPTTPTIYKISDISEHPIEYNAHLGRYTNFTNLADLSAVALPAGFRADDLPVGISLIAPAWHDDALAVFAQRWQAHLQLPLGATQRPYVEWAQSVNEHSTKFLSRSKPCHASGPSPHHVRVAVVGAHLTGMPLNFQLTTRQAVFVERAFTSAAYALYALDGTQPAKPGLVRNTQIGKTIELELWDIPVARFGEFVAEIVSPLGMGNVELDDGRWVKGFICEPFALAQAQEISHFGGWRAYIQAK